MNPWWAMKRGEGFDFEPLFPAALKSRSQDLGNLFCPTGAIWIAGVESLMKAGTFYGPGYKMFPISWESAIDIDDFEDLKFAKAVKAMQETEEQKNEIVKLKKSYKKTVELLESIPMLKQKIKRDKRDVVDMKKESFGTSSFHTNKKPEGPKIDDEIRHLQKLRNRERALIRTEKLSGKLISLIMSMKNEEFGCVLEMRYIKGLSFGDIAEKLKCSKRTVERRHKKLIQKLQVLIDGADALGGGEQ
jgi:predicted DNA-binding protein (UPF0251 family)